MIILKEFEKLKNKINYQLVKKAINFQHEFLVINVVGTNGKGSVTKYLADNLMTFKKYSIGVFSSPHLITYNERIKINNQTISDQDFQNLYLKYKYLNNFFAILFAIAINYFKEKKIDIAIIEAGIGGKKDITKLLKGEYGILTSIGLDHQAILGNTLEKILKQKNGIRNSRMKFYFPSFLKTQFKNKIKGILINVQSNDNYKTRNQKLVKGFLKKEFNILKPFFNEPLGRTSILTNAKNAKIIFDVAHNEMGILNSLNYLKEQNINFEKIIISYQKTKKMNQLPSYFNHAKIFWIKLNKDFANYDHGEKITLEKAKTIIVNTTENILIIGSFYLVGAIWKMFYKTNIIEKIEQSEENIGNGVFKKLP